MTTVRLWILCLTAISVSLGTAFSAIGRLSIYLLAVWVIGANFIRSRSVGHKAARVSLEPWMWASFVILAYSALSILWSEADSTKAVLSWTRHARFLTIPVVWFLLHNNPSAQWVLRIFVTAQMLLVASSWMLIWHLPVPWATASDASQYYAVFGSYLEQSIMTATTAFVVWHQRHWIFGERGQLLAVSFVIASIVQVLGFLNGRTGYLVVIALTSLSIFYLLSKKWRGVAIVIPFIVVATVYSGSATVRHRVALVQNEVAEFSKNSNIQSSSGERLIYWQTSLAAIVERPLLGSGSGGWNHEFRRLTQGHLDRNFYNVDNPHQMFLLWAVEGGLVGLGLLASLLLALFFRSRSMSQPDARSLQTVLAALIVAGMTTSTVYGIGLGDYFCVLIGILLASDNKVAQPASLDN